MIQDTRVDPLLNEDSMECRFFGEWIWSIFSLFIFKTWRNKLQDFWPQNTMKMMNKLKKMCTFVGTQCRMPISTIMLESYAANPLATAERHPLIKTINKTARQQNYRRNSFAEVFDLHTWWMYPLLCDFFCCEWWFRQQSIQCILHGLACCTSLEGFLFPLFLLMRRRRQWWLHAATHLSVRENQKPFI